MFDFRIPITVCCVVLFCVAALPHLVTPKTIQSASSPEASIGPKKHVAETKIEFTEGNMGEIETADGIRLGFTNFKASDGVSVRILYWDFDDQLGVKKAFEKELARASKVLERGEKVDGAGKVVGERAQVLLQTTDHLSVFGIVWTDGVKFHEIRSASLRDALGLEKVYKY